MDLMDVACTPKYLPAEMAEPAAATAIAQNPTNRPNTNGASTNDHSILSPSHIAVLVSKWWSSKGVDLTVAFMEQTQNDLKNRLLSHMNAWGEYANIRFRLSATDPQVRITRALEGYWSYLGTDILHINKNEATMCLQGFTMQTSEAEFRRVVRHETGHTMGCPHEHMRSAIVDRIDVQKAIAYFRQTQGWSAAMVMNQVLKPLAESSLMGSPDADETSIMAYNLPGIITKDGRPIIGGDDIAPQDIEFIGKIYPKQSAPPEPPLPPVGKGLDLNMDFEKKQVHVRLPSGWTVLKLSNQGEVKMSDQYIALADQLQAALPQVESDLEAARATSFGGIIGGVQELIAALRSGDVTVIIRSVRNLLDLLLGDEETETEVIGFAGQAAAFKIDWASLIGVLVKLLPLILGGKS